MLNIATIFILAAMQACQSEIEILEPDGNTEEVTEEVPASLHDQDRELPYPREDNEIYLNPTPLFVPGDMKESDYVQFALSMDPEFPDNATVVSEPAVWCMYNPHRQMETGIWYWRFRSVSKDGVAAGWSETFSFEVKPDTPVFVTPSFERFEYGIPDNYPKLFSFLDEGLATARERVTEHPEYSQLLGRARPGLNYDIAAVSDPYAASGTISGHIERMYQAYMLTLNPDYQDKMLEIIRAMLAYPVSDSDLFGGNFHMAALLRAFSYAYDVCHDRLEVSERTAVINLIYRLLERWYSINASVMENTMFSNHFWQKCYRSILQGLITVYGSPYCPDNGKLAEIFRYYYELWTARAPAHGFNRDGSWLNGGYYGVNIVTLTYVPAVMSYCSGTDFLQHPWYQNAGKALAYVQQGMLFGDQSGRDIGDSPERLYLAFADFLARENQDPYAAWCASEFASTMRGDYELRLYRMVRDWQDEYKYSGLSLPEYIPGFNWYKDAGEVSMLSDLEDNAGNLRLAFRSSPYGSGRHKHSDQNSFNVIYKNTYVYHNTGYYLNSQDAHNLMSYRHTRAHNTVLVNGIGQPYSIAAYGNVTRGMGGRNISYCMGDASHAYKGECDDTYDEILVKAGIEQTQENGFGPTPLSKFYRHVLMLNEDKIVIIYDELEADEPATWDWLLHSDNPFTIGVEGGHARVSNEFPESDFMSVTDMFSDYPYQVDTTSKFAVEPDLSYDPSAVCPDQWHLRLKFPAIPKNRVLAVIQVADDGQSAVAVTRNGDSFTCGDWEIKAELDADKFPLLAVKNVNTDIQFIYGYEEAEIAGVRKTSGSSMLYDMTENGLEVMEMSDRSAMPTRTKIFK